MPAEAVLAPIVPEGVPSFRARLAAAGRSLRAGAVTTLQLNLGRTCNIACNHCHVLAGPGRREAMSAEVAARVIELMETAKHLEVLDLTGGAPEMNPHFCDLVRAGRRRGLRVMDRCNLVILLEPGYDWVAPFLAEHRVEVVASLPCYEKPNVDGQRGVGVFEGSIEALRILNDLGYGRRDDLRLDLVYNPTGAFLPPPQEKLEARYREVLAERYGIVFHRLLTITNLPIGRFAADLARRRALADYYGLLAENFNPATVEGLMCRSHVSVDWTGHIADCDFNQMLGMDLEGRPSSVWEIASLDDLAGRPVATGPHCFGCTAGAGSSCGGALVSG